MFYFSFYYLLRVIIVLLVLAGLILLRHFLLRKKRLAIRVWSLIISLVGSFVLYLVLIENPIELNYMKFDSVERAFFYQFGTTPNTVLINKDSVYARKDFTNCILLITDDKYMIGKRSDVHTESAELIGLSGDPSLPLVENSVEITGNSTVEDRFLIVYSLEEIDVRNSDGTKKAEVISGEKINEKFFLYENVYINIIQLDKNSKQIYINDAPYRIKIKT